VRFGGHAGHGGHRGGRCRGGQGRALALAAALAAVTFTAGCAALGSGAAAPATASGPAGQASAGQGAASPGAASPGPRAAAAAPTLTRRPAGAASGSPAARGSSAAAAAPGSSVTAGQPATGRTTAGQTTAGQTTGAQTTGSQPSGDQRLVTFVNDMRQTIWVAAAPSAASPLAATGWVLPAGQSVTITTPNNLNTRFWGRTGCVFSSAGVGHCQTGDCGGLFQCQGWGTIPATLAEVNFDAWRGLDFYDVSMVDGSNLPMWINITRSSGGTTDKISPNGCVAAGCTKPVNCPSALDVKVGDAVVGCISACARLGGDQYCCRGPYSSRAACDPAQWPVDYAAVFKSAEPYAYSYVDDDATSVFTCSGVCDYRITFGITP
jgi:hypothetical protein